MWEPSMSGRSFTSKTAFARCMVFLRLGGGDLRTTRTARKPRPLTRTCERRLPIKAPHGTRKWVDGVGRPLIRSAVQQNRLQKRMSQQPERRVRVYGQGWKKMPGVLMSPKTEQSRVTEGWS